MRCNQVSIFIERFGEYVPENYPGDVQRISVYVDDFNSIYAALSKAHALVVNELAEYEQIGARANVSTNEFSQSDYKEMHGSIPKQKRNYETDINLEYGDSLYELCLDYVWAFEHSNELIELIKESLNCDDMIIRLKDKYELSDYQIRKLSQIRFDMLTREEYEKCKAKICKIEDWRAKKETVDIHTYRAESYKKYIKKQCDKVKLRIEELEAYFKVADNYHEMILLMEENEEFHQFADSMKEKFGLSWNQCKYFSHMSIRDFNKKNRIKREMELEELKEDLKRYSED